MSPSISHQTVRLSRGKHASAIEGACVMELASMLAGEPFTDHPKTVCPVIAAYLRSLNDLAGDEHRHLLLPYAAAAVGTAGDERVQRLRIERCRREFDALGERRSTLGRVITRLAPPRALDTQIALEHFAAAVVRSLRRTGEGWHLRALALADELIAAGGGGPDREPEPAPAAPPALSGA